MLVRELDAKLVAILKNTRVASKDERAVALQAGADLVYRTAASVAGGDYFYQESALTILANTSRSPLDDTTVFPKTVTRIRKIVSRGTTAADLRLGSGFGEGGFGEGGFGGGVAAMGTASFNGKYIFVRRDHVHPEFLRAEMRDPVSEGVVYFDLTVRTGVPTLMLAPALLTDEVVLIATTYRPTKIVAADLEPDATSTVEPLVERFDDLAVFRAVEVLLRAVNDSDGDKWGADALQQRSAMIQDLGRLVESENGFVATGMDWGDV